jgi:outer membrane protein insertion porin family
MDFRMKKAFILIVFIILFSLLSAAGELVYDIRVEGNTNVDASLILSASSIKIGSPLKGDDAQKTIKNLYNLKVFEDVRIESQPKQSGIEIIISVREHPVVTKINFKGNKALSTKEVEEIINIRKGSYWSQNLKLGNTEKLKVKYQEKGYLNAEIDYISKESDDNTTILTLVFNEGRKVKIKKINIKVILQLN